MGSGGNNRGSIMALVLLLGMIGAIAAAAALGGALSLNKRNAESLPRSQAYLTARSTAELAADKLLEYTSQDEMPFFGRGYKLITIPGFLGGEDADSMKVDVEVSGLSEEAGDILLTIRPYKMSFDLDGLSYDLIEVIIEAKAEVSGETFSRKIHMRNYRGVDYSFVHPPEDVTTPAAFYGVSVRGLHIWKYE